MNIKDSFELEFSFDYEDENVFIASPTSSGAEYYCKTLEDLLTAVEDYALNYIGLKRRIFVDMDGTLAKWKEVQDETELYQKNFYGDMKPNSHLLEKIRDMVKKGEDIYVLSSVLSNSKFALNEKKKWLDKYFPELEKDKIIFVPYGEKKSKYVPYGLSCNDYLIDDFTQNLLEWKNASGTGIKFLNGINHTKGTWKGLLLGEDEQLSNNLEKLLQECETNYNLENNIDLDITDEM